MLSYKRQSPESLTDANGNNPRPKKRAKRGKGNKPAGSSKEAADGARQGQRIDWDAPGLRRTECLQSGYRWKQEGKTLIKHSDIIERVHYKCQGPILKKSSGIKSKSQTQSTNRCQGQPEPEPEKCPARIGVEFEADAGAPGKAVKRIVHYQEHNHARGPPKPMVHEGVEVPQDAQPAPLPTAARRVRRRKAAAWPDCGNTVPPPPPSPGMAAAATALTALPHVSFPSSCFAEPCVGIDRAPLPPPWEGREREQELEEGAGAAGGPSRRRRSSVSDVLDGDKRPIDLDRPVLEKLGEQLGKLDFWADVTLLPPSRRPSSCDGQANMEAAAEAPRRVSHASMPEEDPQEQHPTEPPRRASQSSSVAGFWRWIASAAARRLTPSGDTPAAQEDEVRTKVDDWCVFVPFEGLPDDPSLCRFMPCGSEEEEMEGNVQAAEGQEEEMVKKELEVEMREEEQKVGEVEEVEEVMREEEEKEVEGEVGEVGEEGVKMMGEEKQEQEEEEGQEEEDEQELEGLEEEELEEEELEEAEVEEEESEEGEEEEEEEFTKPGVGAGRAPPPPREAKEQEQQVEEVAEATDELFRCTSIEHVIRDIVDPAQGKPPPLEAAGPMDWVNLEDHEDHWPVAGPPRRGSRASVLEEARGHVQDRPPTPAAAEPPRARQPRLDAGRGPSECGGPPFNPGGRPLPPGPA